MAEVEYIASIRPRKIKSQNIISRLLERERWGAKKPGTSSHVVRDYYQSIFPNLSITHVDKPPCFLRKFSPDGKYLIAFSCDQVSLEIYQYLGCAMAGELISECNKEMISEDTSVRKEQEIRAQIFDKLFKLRHVVNLGSNSIHLNRECSLFTNDGKYVIVGAAASIPEESQRSFYDIYTTNEYIKPTAKFPFEDYWLYLVDLENGCLSDSRCFRTDKIILSHNQGLCLYNNTLAVLSIQHQTVHTFEISEGEFCDLQKVGRFCTNTENILYHQIYPKHINRPFREETINSLKHHILVHLFRKAKLKCDQDGNKTELRLFYHFFDQYKHLKMWKMQLIDDNNLLIRYTSEEVVTLKIQEPSNYYRSFFVVYNLNETKVIDVFDNTSEELLYLFENFCDIFRNSQVPRSAQFISSPSNNIFSKFLQDKSKQTVISAKGGSHIEATKRLLAQLPISAQSFSSSPYLDLSLFSYDDKLVSVMERPKACSEYPIRFFDRDSGILKFRIYPGFQSMPPIATALRLVAFAFHPIEPFAISVQRIQTAEYVVNFHIRHSLLGADAVS